MNRPDFAAIQRNLLNSIDELERTQRSKSPSPQDLNAYEDYLFKMGDPGAVQRKKQAAENVKTPSLPLRGRDYADSLATAYAQESVLGKPEDAARTKSLLQAYDEVAAKPPTALTPSQQLNQIEVDAWNAYLNKTANLQQMTLLKNKGYLNKDQTPEDKARYIQGRVADQTATPEETDWLNRYQAVKKPTAESKTETPAAVRDRMTTRIAKEHLALEPPQTGSAPKPKPTSEEAIARNKTITAAGDTLKLADRAERIGYTDFNLFVRDLTGLGELIQRATVAQRGGGPQAAEKIVKDELGEDFSLNDVLTRYTYLKGR